MLCSDLISVKGHWRRLLQLLHSPTLLVAWGVGWGGECLETVKGTLLTVHAHATHFQRWEVHIGVGGCGTGWMLTVGNQFVAGGPLRRSLHVKCIKQQTILIPSPTNFEMHTGCLKHQTELQDMGSTEKRTERAISKQQKQSSNHLMIDSSGHLCWLSKTRLQICPTKL